VGEPSRLRPAGSPPSARRRRWKGRLTPSKASRVGPAMPMPEVTGVDTSLMDVPQWPPRSSESLAGRSRLAESGTPAPAGDYANTHLCVAFRLICDKSESGAHLAPRADPNRRPRPKRSYLALLGALGVLVGLALATTIRTRVDRPAAALAHALRNVSTTSAPTRTRTGSQSRKPADAPKTHRPM
jgi:hypothetical protein